jgi:alkyl hydroperoxide reductase subunit F
MLDQATIEQLKSVFSDLESDYRFIVEAHDHPAGEELLEMLQDVASTSDRIGIELKPITDFRFHLEKDGSLLPIEFKGIPGGHEFTTLILAILNADGKGKLPDAGTRRRIHALKGPIHLTSYISISCVNCPDVVQALNQMALIHPDFKHEMVEGTHFEEEIISRKIQGVPAVFTGEKIIHVGKATMSDLLEKLEYHFGSAPLETDSELLEYDVAVIGGGPAGAAAAIYTARKGLKTAILSENIGGQVTETKGIENFISTPYTEGPQLAADLYKHLDTYPIDILENRRVERIEDGPRKTLHMKGGETLSTGALILATGAKWRHLGIPGEQENIGRGVAFCPHCEGPFYKGRPVAVVGGGNSGVEAAIDLAGICDSVTLIEYAAELTADEVLIRKLDTLPNAVVMTNTETVRVLDSSDKVSGIEVRSRDEGAVNTIGAEGIFVQIGLTPNSEFLGELVSLNPYGEIEIDSHCRTGRTGVYACGDVTDVPFKQIIVAMGEGAKAGLSVFEDFARGHIEPLTK